MRLLNKVVSRNDPGPFSFFILRTHRCLPSWTAFALSNRAGKKPPMETDLALFTLYPRMKTAALDVPLTIVISCTFSQHQQPVNRPVFTLIIAGRSHDRRGSTFARHYQGPRAIPWNIPVARPFAFIVHSICETTRSRWLEHDSRSTDKANWIACNDVPMRITIERDMKMRLYSTMSVSFVPVRAERQARKLMEKIRDIYRGCGDRHENVALDERWKKSRQV